MSDDFRYRIELADAEVSPVIDRARHDSMYRARLEVALEQLRRERICQQCGQPFTGKYSAKFCGVRCRVAAHRAIAKG